MAARVCGNSQVSSKARSISVMSSDVCWAGGVEGLDVNQEVGACPVVITEDDIRGMANPSAVALHPLVNSTLATPRPPRSAVTLEEPRIASRKGTRVWTVGSWAVE